MGSIKEGAEAQIFKTSFLGLEAVGKLRVSKDYREKSLDCKILLERLRTECSLIHKAKKAGVRTPLIFDINKKKLSITMEFIKGKTMKEILEKNPESAERLCKEAGKIISKLHCFGIIAMTLCFRILAWVIFQKKLKTWLRICFASKKALCQHIIIWLKNGFWLKRSMKNFFQHQKMFLTG